MARPVHLISMVAIAVLFALIPSLAPAQGAGWTPGGGIGDPVAPAGTGRDVSTLTEEQLSAAILAAWQAQGFPDPPYNKSLADEHAAAMKNGHTKAATWSVVHVNVGPGGQPRTALVWIASLVGDNAWPSTLGHENARRAANQTLALADFLTSFLNLLSKYGGTGTAGLSHDEVTRLMNNKLDHLEIVIQIVIHNLRIDDLKEHGIEWNGRNEQSAGESVATLIRSAFQAIFARVLASLSLVLGNQLTAEQIQSALDLADRVVDDFADSIETYGKLDELRKKLQDHPDKFLQDILGK